MAENKMAFAESNNDVLKNDPEIFKMEIERLNNLSNISEEFGEKRTTLMITITGFLFGGFFALLQDDPYFFFKNDFLLYLLILALIFLSLLGWLTLVRMAYRNINTDEYKEGIRRIKEYYVTNYEAYVDIDRYLFFHSKHKTRPRKDRESRGGFIEVVRLINSVLIGLCFYMLSAYIFFKPTNSLSSGYILAALVISLCTGIIYWLIQGKKADKIYDNNCKKFKLEDSKQIDCTSETLKYRFFSKEVRWFLWAKPVELESWFKEKRELLFEDAAERSDFYLAVCPNQNISYKLREGKTEIKLKESNTEVITFANGHRGCVENWVKWSLPLKEGADTPDLLFDTSKLSFIELKKKRILIKFGLSKGGEMKIVGDKDFSPEGCQVELTYIKSKDRDYYSFGFEAYGSKSSIDRNFDIVAKKVLEEIKSSGLKEKNSLNYPAFVAGLFNPDIVS